MSQAKKTDAQIHADVIEELRWDPRVSETDVGVEVDDGIVTLSGTVESWAARTAAEKAAHRVSGVLDVANDVAVKPTGGSERTDTEIAQAARDALVWDALVPHDRIRTTVSNGILTLEGKVHTWTEHDDAARAVRNLRGVRELRNLIEIQPAAVAPSKVRSAIDAALHRHATHASRHVTIAVDDGTVILSGEVPSWAERKAIEGAVRGTAGVRKVDNRLGIHV